MALFKKYRVDWKQSNNKITNNKEEKGKFEFFIEEIIKKKITDNWGFNINPKLSRFYYEIYSDKHN